MPTRIPFPIVLLVTIIAGIAVLVIGYERFTVRPAALPQPSFSASSTTAHAASHPAPAGATETAPTLAGEWRSTDDPKFMRTIREDGTFTDAYQGEPSATANGQWRIFDASQVRADFPYPLDAGASYLEFDDASGTTLYFKIVSLATSSLALMYLDRGNMLLFDRVAGQ
ncbi:MAG TPA: hypothetical protein VFL98_00275 [Candidatus Paceibacterota bacterium]|nr:hypothetical protein [Candidatus Paceibacterota bacterium]